MVGGHCTTLVDNSTVLVWPAKMGLVPFWQPPTLCFVAVIVQRYIFVVLWRINLLSSLSETSALTKRHPIVESDDK